MTSTGARLRTVVSPAVVRVLVNHIYWPNSIPAIMTASDLRLRLSTGMSSVWRSPGYL
jgi:hypothetical protein